MSDGPLLCVRELTVDHRARGRVVRAVERVSFDVAAGETLAIVGESGAGKTSLARAIVGLAVGASGSVRFRGERGELDVLGGTREGRLEFRKQAQIVFQDAAASLDPRRTILDQVAEPLVAHGLARGAAARDVASAALARLALEPTIGARLPHEASHGQLARAALARALVLQPRLLVLDEPLAPLDLSVQARIVNLLATLRRERAVAYVLISHDLEMVRWFADRVLVMQAARVVEEIAAERLLDAPAHPYTRALVASMPGR